MMTTADPSRRTVPSGRAEIGMLVLNRGARQQQPTPTAAGCWRGAQGLENMFKEVPRETCHPVHGVLVIFHHERWRVEGKPGC